MAKADGFLVLIAVDGSAHSEQAVRWYATGVHAEGSKVILIHTMDAPFNTNMAQQVEGDGAAADICEQLMEKEKEKVQPIEKKYSDILKENGIKCTFKVLLGKPGEAIVREAESEQAGMIVTGTRGLGTLRRTIMGSVSDYILHHAHCPVLICKH